MNILDKDIKPGQIFYRQELNQDLTDRKILYPQGIENLLTGYKGDRSMSKLLLQLPDLSIVSPKKVDIGKGKEYLIITWNKNPNGSLVSYLGTQSSLAYQALVYDDDENGLAPYDVIVDMIKTVRDDIEETSKEVRVND
jgi:hypothetical protein